MVGRASKPRAMKRLSFAAAMALAAFAAGPAAAADPATVVVFAAASLREAFEAAAPVFTKQTGVR
jgi:ABC-type molybdate transport system substrate-binding protein